VSCFFSGHHVQVLTYGDGQWVVVSEKVRVFCVVCFVCVLLKTLTPLMNEHLLVWIVTLSHFLASSLQTPRDQGYYLCTGDFPMNKVKELYKEGKAIHSITYAEKEDLWVVLWEIRPFVQSLHAETKFPEHHLHRFGF
jgi:hypothetical protein